MRFALPTEAQWEYACRAGAMSSWQWGNRDDNLGQYGWVESNSGGTTHAVGRLRSNGFGLYDMHGNVAEWCEDWFAGDYYAEAPVNDPTGPSARTNRVFRGGGCGHDCEGLSLDIAAIHGTRQPRS